MKINSRIIIPKKVLKKGLKIKPLAMKNMRSTIHNRLSVFHSSFLLLLHLNKKPLKMIYTHDAVFRVLVCFDCFDIVFEGGFGKVLRICCSGWGRVCLLWWQGLGLDTLLTMMKRAWNTILDF
ncbi:hypothetical protein HanRHA438_Chr08g0345651 [Helianthus annuus]|nr:hypothetical protein HanRHA438_Chr08g0345651 [Helianthus annuus]